MSRASSSELGSFDTRAVHAGQQPDPSTGAVVTPISLSTTFAQDGVGGHRGFEYSRSGNPTRAALEACVACLESARHGLAFASGLAAEDNVLRLVPPGGRVILGNDAYGGTFRLIARVWGPLGMRVDGRRPDRRRRPRGTGRPTPRWCGWRRRRTRCSRASTSRPWRPSPTTTARSSSSTTRSPRRTCSSPSRSAPTSSCTRRRSTSAATATSSAGSWPSTTTRSSTGCGSRRTRPAACPHRSTATSCCAASKTLAVRMERHCSNARAVVDLLVGHPAVDRVLYPQLPDHPGHAAAARQMRDFGGMVSFTLRGGADAASVSPRRPSSSCSPSRSVRSRASSSTRVR